MHTYTVLYLGMEITENLLYIKHLQLTQKVLFFLTLLHIFIMHQLLPLSLILCGANCDKMYVDLSFLSRSGVTLNC